VTWIVRVVADAEAEFEAAARWYDEHAGLRIEFVEAIDEAIFAIADGPQQYPLWRPESSYRKYVVRRFPLRCPLPIARGLRRSDGIRAHPKTSRLLEGSRLSKHDGATVVRHLHRPRTLALNPVIHNH
jgi:hypothetical protein